MSDSKSNVGSVPSQPGAAELVTLSPAEGMEVLPAAPDETAAIVATPEPVTMQATSAGLGGAGMLLMLAFVVILMVVLTMLDKAKKRREDARAPVLEKPAGKPIENPAKPQPANLTITPHPSDEADVAAVISAVISIMMEEQSAPASDAAPVEPPLPPEAWRVRRVRRRAASTPVWHRTGLEAQVYSRIV